jgi:acetyl-CoA acetyltransferase
VAEGHADATLDEVSGPRARVEDHDRWLDDDRDAPPHSFLEFAPSDARDDAAPLPVEEFRRWDDTTSEAVHVTLYGGVISPLIDDRAPLFAYVAGDATLPHAVAAVFAAAAQGASFDSETMTSYHRDDLCGLPDMGVVAKRLWRDSGLAPADIDTAFLYDHFTPFVLMELEELGFCGRGEAEDWATVERLSVGGELPINTNGGLLGEAYIHGMNGITEVVRQIRGTSYNQVDNVEHALATAGTGVPTSGLILSTA